MKNIHREGKCSLKLKATRLKYYMYTVRDKENNKLLKYNH